MIKYPEKEYPRTDILRWDIDLCAVLDAALETKGSLCEHGEGIAGLESTSVAQQLSPLIDGELVVGWR